MSWMARRIAQIASGFLVFVSSSAMSQTERVSVNTIVIFSGMVVVFCTTLIADAMDGDE